MQAGPGNRQGNFLESKSDAKTVLEAGCEIFIPLLSREIEESGVGPGGTLKIVKRKNSLRSPEIVHDGVTDRTLAHNNCCVSSEDKARQK